MTLAFLKNLITVLILLQAKPTSSGVLRWLSTVLRAVSGNLRDGASFKLDKQTWHRKSNGTQKTISQNLLIKIL